MLLGRPYPRRAMVPSGCYYLPQKHFSTYDDLGPRLFLLAKPLFEISLVQKAVGRA